MDEKLIVEKIGSHGIRRMVTEFYKLVPDDNILGPMYPEKDMLGAEDRLYKFLMFRLAGDQSYIEQRGHPRLRARHMPFSIGAKERDRWVSLMHDAMVAAAFPDDVVEALDAFFFQVADFMRNQNEGSGVDFNPRA